MKKVCAAFAAVCILICSIITPSDTAFADEPQYTRPNAEQILSDFGAMNGVHPRIMATADTFESIRGRRSTNERIAAWCRNVIKDADGYLSQPHSKYEKPDGLRLLEVSRLVLNRSLALGMAYQLTGETKYAEYLWGEYEAVGNFPDWNPANHFLDTAEMTNAVAIGYDWCYDYWTEERRQFIEKTIMDYGLQYAEKAYSGDKVGSSWVKVDTNWNAVCNGGMAVGALALMDVYPERCAAIIQNGLRSLEYMLGEFAPDGAWVEGPTYWSYCISYYVYHMAAMNTALGTDYGYSEVTGLDKTCYYPTYNTGPQGMFNLGDGGTGVINNSAAFFFGKRLNDKNLITLRLTEMQMNGRGGGVLDLLFYDPDLVSEPNVGMLDPDRYVRRAETATFRSAWNDQDALFAGIHGGDNSANHGDLDGGTFVLDALGERWAWELGQDDYNLDGYFSDGVNGKRWNYYRCNTQGQNVLTLNPVSETGQYPKASMNITKYESKPKGGYAVVDMTDAYPNKVTYARRGMMVDRETEQVVVQDELNLTSSNDLWWFMHTKAKIEIGEDGKTALLSQNSKLMYVTLESNVREAEFIQMKAEPLPNSPNAAGQDANSDYTKLAVNLPEANGNVTLSVRFVPIKGGRSVLDRYIAQGAAEMVPIDEWTIADGELAKPELITLMDGAKAESGKPLMLAVDPDGISDIEKVEFYVGNTSVGEAAEAEDPLQNGRPVYLCKWTPAEQRSYTLWARVFKNSGEVIYVPDVVVNAYRSTDVGRSSNFSNLKVNGTGTGISGYGLKYQNSDTTGTGVVYSAAQVDSAHGRSLKLHSDGNITFSYDQALNISMPTSMDTGGIFVTELEARFTNRNMGLSFAGYGVKKDGSSVNKTIFKLSDGSFSTGGVYNENEWYKIKIVCDLDEGYYDVYINDIRVAAYEHFTNSLDEFSKFTRLKLMYSAGSELNAGDIFIDNTRFARIVLPEPADETVQDALIKANGLAVSDITELKAGDSVELSAESVLKESGDICLAVAYYSGDVLNDASVISQTAPEAGVLTKLQSEKLILSKTPEEGDIIRGYIWRKDMQPVSEYFELK